MHDYIMKTEHNKEPLVTLVGEMWILGCEDALIDITINDK